MITDFIIKMFMSCVSAVLSIIPTITLPSPSSTADGYISIVHEANQIFPVTDLILLLLASLAIILALQVWDFGLWVYHQIWGSD